MKKLITALILLLSIQTNAQHGNLCSLLVKSFNTSDEGFPFLRPGTNVESMKDFTINSDTINNYGLKNGSILKYPNLQSEKFNNKTFTAWTLLLSGQKQLLQEKKWDDVKETVTAQFTSFAKQYADGCFPQLQMSELILPSNNQEQLLVYYFYPKQITIPKNADNETIENLLRESTYIRFAVDKTWGVNGYYISYSVNGLKYNN